MITDISGLGKLVIILKTIFHQGESLKIWWVKILKRLLMISKQLYTLLLVVESMVVTPLCKVFFVFVVVMVLNKSNKWNLLKCFNYYPLCSMLWGVLSVCLSVCDTKRILEKDFLIVLNIEKLEISHRRTSAYFGVASVVHFIHNASSFLLSV